MDRLAIVAAYAEQEAREKEVKAGWQTAEVSMGGTANDRYDGRSQPQTRGP